MTKLLFAAMLLPALTFAHEYGPDPGYAGAPGTKVSGSHPMSCATAMCHSNDQSPNGPGGPINAFGGGVMATFSGGSSYTPGGPPITITVSVSDPVNSRYGFQMTARPESDLANSQAGDFNVGTSQSCALGLTDCQLVLCDDGSVKVKKCPAAAPIEYIEHDYPKGSQVGGIPYTFTWTPPATNVGPVHFYVAGNAVNGDVMADGKDHVYTATYVLTPVLCTTTTPTVSAVISAGAYGALPTFASGSWIEIYGSNFSSSTWQWSGIDFNGTTAPTSLAGVNVSINNNPAFVWFLSSGQVNVLAPEDSTTGSVNVTLSNCSNASAPFSATKAALAPGLLSPPGFLVNGKQYVVALHSDQTYVGNPNSIPGVTSTPAKPGELLVLYGIGFGDAKDSNGNVIPSGTVPSGVSTLVNPVTISFGSTPATLVYAGLTPGSAGLYQFDVTVPSVANGDVAFNVTQSGKAITQKLFLTVHD